MSDVPASPSGPAFRNEGGVAIVRAMIDVIAANRQHLSDIDGLIGDGDHGVNMNKGFQQCATQLGPDTASLSASLRVLGLALLEIGGSMGPLYSSLFRAMGSVADKHDWIDAAVFESMLAAAGEKIRAVGECQPGDKTLLDVLAPARTAFAATREAGGTFPQALEALKAAAAAGRDATTSMIARRGRASRLGERSRGVPDPGATSCCLLLTTLATGAAARLSMPPAAAAPG